MKEVSAYQCEKCNGIYETEEKASMCEGNHAKNIIVTNAWFDQGKDNPSRIEISWVDSKGKKRGSVWEKY